MGTQAIQSTQLLILGLVSLLDLIFLLWFCEHRQIDWVILNIFLITISVVLIVMNELLDTNYDALNK